MPARAAIHIPLPRGPVTLLRVTLVLLAVNTLGEPPTRTPVEGKPPAKVEKQLSPEVHEILKEGREGKGHAAVGTLAEKPDSFDSWADRLDYVHDNLYLGVQNEVLRWDSLAASTNQALMAVPPSRFKFTLEFQYEEEGSKGKFKVNPDLKVDIRVPNLENRLKVFIDFSDVDELPGTTVSERTNEPRIGVGTETKIGRQRVLNTRLGVKWRLPPVGFAELETRKLIKWENGFVYPRLKGFYETDDGFGSLASVQAERWFDRRWLHQPTAAVRWTEKSNGVEWEASFLSVYLLSSYHDQNSELENIHRGLGVQGSVFGHKTGSGVVDRYRLIFGYRIPLYKEWIYLTVYPEVQWQNEHDWETDPGLRIAFDMLFWGTPQR